MGQTRTPESAPSSQGAQVAALIALLLAGVEAERVARMGGLKVVVTALLATLVPASLPAALRASVSASVATFVLRGNPKPSGSSGAVLAARRENLLRRGRYAIEAVKRLSGAVLADEDGLSEALSRERVHFRRHLLASETRLWGARLNEAAASRWGPVLGWRHKGTSATHRPAHEKADGSNYLIDRPPRSTGGLPATLPHCDCLPGPPIRGARLLR